MSQNIRATPCSSGRQGSTAKVEASGMAIMSDSSMALKPVIEEPSKPIPPSKASSSSAALIENDLSWPRMSVNQKRMKRMECSSTNALTSSAVVGCSVVLMSGKPSGGRLDRRLKPGGQSGHAPPVLQPWHLRDAPAGRHHRRQLRAHGGP